MPTDEPPFWLVWNPNGRDPIVRHPTLREAQQEADRLARAVPGIEFYVLVPASVSVRNDVVTRQFNLDGRPF